MKTTLTLLLFTLTAFAFAQDQIEIEASAIEIFTVDAEGKLVPLNASNSAEARHMIGISAEPLASHLAKAFDVPGGLLITRVHEGTPAQKAGLSKQDIVLKANGKPVSELQQLADEVAAAGEAGKAVKLSLRREEGEVEMAITPAKQQTAAAVSVTVLDALNHSDRIVMSGASVVPSPVTADGGVGVEVRKNKEAIEKLRQQLEELNQKLQDLAK